jgi:hypothetical protein
MSGTFGGSIDSLHTLQTTTPDGRDLVFFTGTIVIIDAFPGSGEGTAVPDPDGWARGTIEVDVGPSWEQLDSVAPAAAPASFFSILFPPRGTDPGFGWATDRCNWRINVVGQLVLQIDVAVASTTADALLLRIAFQATAIGVLAS